MSRWQAERRAPVEAAGLGASWFIQIEPFLPGRLHRHGRPAKRRACFSLGRAMSPQVRPPPARGRSDRERRRGAGERARDRAPEEDGAATELMKLLTSSGLARLQAARDGDAEHLAAGEPVPSERGATRRTSAGDREHCLCGGAPVARPGMCDEEAGSRIRS